MKQATEDTMGVGFEEGLALSGFGAAVRREILPVLAAALVVACFVFSARETPLPALGWAAAFLFCCVQQDVRGMRIPNWLTLPGLVVAIAVAAIDSGFQGVLWSLAGAGTALGLLFVPFVFRWLGATQREAGARSVHCALESKSIGCLPYEQIDVALIHYQPSHVVGGAIPQQRARVRTCVSDRQTERQR